MTIINTHPLQSKEWAEFRKKTGVTVVEVGENFMTVHKIPKTPWNIGYFPKGPMPTKKTIEQLKKVGREHHCIFIQLEPNEISNEKSKLEIQSLGLVPSAHPLFTKYTFQLDITSSEEELLKHMHSKTRYNIRVAQKHEVIVTEDNSNEAFAQYLRITHETTKRQGFYAHTDDYHKKMWETLRSTRSTFDKEKLTAHLFKAVYEGKTLVTWIVFVYKNALYYPYGASSSLHREVMASNAMMWEVIRYGKRMGLKTFDMWGALGPNPDPKDPWYGFHRFKQGYGATLIEFAGSYDLIINPLLYPLYVVADKLRWVLLKLKK